MKKIIIFSLLGFLLLAGCMQMETEEKCLHMDPDEVLTNTAWGENFVSTDESVVKKANITCWHNAALTYTAKSDLDNATRCCDQILKINNDPADKKDTLYPEYVLCIDAVAVRLQNNETCLKIATKDPDLGANYDFEKKQCIKHATPPPPICSTAPVVAFILGATLFVKRRR